MVLSDHYKPCPEEWMKQKNPRFTICEVIRQIYYLSPDAQIKTLCRIAMTMAKKMNTKLMEYNPIWQEVFDGKTDKIKSQIGGEQCKK